MIGNPSEITPSGHPGRCRSVSRRCVLPGSDRHLGRCRTLGGRSPSRGPAGGQRLGQGPFDRAGARRRGLVRPRRHVRGRQRRLLDGLRADPRWPARGRWRLRGPRRRRRPGPRVVGRPGGTGRHRLHHRPGARGPRGRRRQGPGRRGQRRLGPGARDLAPRHRHPAGVRGRGPRHRRRRGVVAEGLGRRHGRERPRGARADRPRLRNGGLLRPQPAARRDQWFGHQLHHDRPDGDDAALPGCRHQHDVLRHRRPVGQRQRDQPRDRLRRRLLRRRQGAADAVRLARAQRHGRRGRVGADPGWAQRRQRTRRELQPLLGALDLS